MTRRGASLRAGSWVWLTPALLMACTSARSVIPKTSDGSGGGVADVTDAGTGGIHTGAGGIYGGAGGIHAGAGGMNAGTGGVDAGAGKLDAKPDSAGNVGGTDATPSDASIICATGAHVCGGQCVSNTDV